MMRFHFFFLAVVCPFLTSAQQEYTSSVPKAVRSFETAAKFYDAKERTKALQSLQEAIDADPKFVEAHMMKGDIHMDLKEYDKATIAYNAAITINPNFFPNNYLLVARAEYMNGQYQNARVHLEKFLSLPKIHPTAKNRAEKLLVNCTFAEAAVLNPVPFDPENMGPGINTAEEEYFPAITADGKTFLFTRRLKSASAGSRPSLQEDFFVSTFEKNAWQTAVPLTDVNTTANEGAPSLSSDGQYLFFTACEERMGQADARKTKGSCDIFITKKIGNKFSKARNLEVPVNSGAWESQPSFSSDGRTLYFIRAVKGSDNITQRDIYVTRIGDNSAWSEPEPLTPLINTSSDEMSVFIHPDDQTLYFSSDGHPGMGGLDIFMSKKDSAGEWTKPVNLGYPINNTGDENSLLVSPDGKKGFFSSDREGGFGMLDLYMFDLPENARPLPVTYMKGKVFDADDKKPLAASFELIDLETSKVIVSSTSNSGNGEYLVCLPTGKSYALNVSKDGYLFHSENFQLKDPASAKEPVLKDVGLSPVKPGESVVLKNIFYETDKFELKKESRAELNKLITFLKKNPKIKFEIGGHTDNVGTPQYNQTLSEKRARAVYDYLVSNGIEAGRVEAKGYGITKPVADNATEKGRSQNRRTEFTILSVQ